jgi:A/G-specific adenine glycosylase
MSDRDNALTPAKMPSFRQALLSWYDRYARELPWRRDRDPYRVWISEIMLQQTRVAAVLDHYARFLRRFPTIESLAGAREASVLALWSGLGYYHRARRMHQAAKVIVRERQGVFPRTAEEWLELPGIGRYTAAAIASIAFGQPVAVVDGNVERVVGRLFGPMKGKEQAWERAQNLLATERPGDFNQAMMELGATICTPRVPQCLICPLHGFCLSRGAEQLAAQPLRKRKQLGYALARQNASVLLVRRPIGASLMAGMWELPALLLEHRNGEQPLLRVRHSITDTDYQVSVFAASDEELQQAASFGRWFTPQQHEQLPLTGLTRKILRRLAPESQTDVGESNEKRIRAKRSAN